MGRTVGGQQKNQSFKRGGCFSCGKGSPLFLLAERKAFMDNAQALEIIIKAAKLYSDDLCNKNLLIIFRNKKKSEFVEVKATLF